MRREEREEILSGRAENVSHNSPSLLNSMLLQSLSLSLPFSPEHKVCLFGGTFLYLSNFKERKFELQRIQCV